jgi:hypothetical protein
MEKLENLINEIGIDTIKNYLNNRPNEKEIKEFIISEIQNCKINFCEDGYYLVKNNCKLFIFDFKRNYLWYDHDKIYLVIMEKYKTNEIKINKICNDILVEYLNYNTLIPNNIICTDNK